MYYKINIPGFIYYLLLLIPLYGSAQQADSLKRSKITRVSGQVTDAVSGRPLPFISISFAGSNYGANSDSLGRFNLSAPGSYNRITFSHVGYQAVTKTIKPGQANELQVRLMISQTQLKEVSVTSARRYRNKGNPAVELIRQVINHKEQNRMESSAYLQYDQYERIGLSLSNVPSLLINNRYLRSFDFMLDTTVRVNERAQTTLPVYFSEKLFKNYYRASPSKSIQVLTAQKEINVIKFVDTVGVDIYLNRLYGNNIDIYSNNIFIINNQFLSPIADHAPDFYQFFITDTIQYGKEKLVEISFTPRNKGDLLFEGRLWVTLDGRYAVKSCDLNVNKQINLNFMRSLQIRLDFEPYPGGRYYLVKSDATADFGVLRNKGIGVLGERTVFYSNYKLNAPLPAAFYQGKSVQTLPNSDQPDTAYWLHHRPDTLSPVQARVYAHITRLEGMSSFKRATWIASTLDHGFADLGPVQAGPIGDFFSFSDLEGARFQLGGRTTPKLNKTVYLEGYAAYGTKDRQLKYELNTYFSLNQTPYYYFPNNYFKVSYLYDINVPGQSFSNSQSALSSFQTGRTGYFLNNRIFAVGYAKDLENHFSYNLTLKDWNQKAAGTLVYQLNDANNTVINNLNTREADLGLRYAPHEQIMQGTFYRRTIVGKYPIFNLLIKQGYTGTIDGAYTYTNIGTTITKRFYLSQLGYADVTMLGGLVIGKVPFPLLNISPANQSIEYNANAYNTMNYLEFVSDHYAGINLTQSFNGFFLNKIPLVQHLKWREYLSAKVLYGGLRNENNPLYTTGLYQFPASSNGTYALGNTPYIEAGAGIGNIFKFFRVDVIKRFNYLDHPGSAPYAIKFGFYPEL